MKKKEGIVFSALLCCLVGVALVSSFSYNLKTRMVPVIVGSGSLILSVMILLGELIPRFRQLFEVDLFTRDKIVSREKLPGKWDEKKGLSIAVFWVLLFAVLLFLAGFNVAVPVCVLIYVRAFGRQSWPASLTVTAMVWVFIFGLFQIIMDYKLFEGILFGGIV
ncbi:MAG: tripartite tricarboxylate transporter TctB family protein [Thermodesulfobacteriota bacterium]